MPLNIGDKAPTFVARSSKNTSLRLEHLAGRFIILTFLEGSLRASSLELAKLLRENESPFDDKTAMHFFVVIGESGEVKDGLGAKIPGHRVYFDKSGEIAANYGVGRETAKPISFLLSPRQQIIDICTADMPLEHSQAIFLALKTQNISHYEQEMGGAPVLRVPYVLESSLCADILAWVTPFFNGLTPEPRIPPDSLTTQDLRRLIRLDQRLNEEELNEKVVRRLMQRVMPEVRRAFNFQAEHIDDVVLTLMRAQDNARCDPMREDGYAAAAHKRFSITILLAGAGGELCFPEFGSSLRPLRIGEALIHSSHLLCETKMVQSGERIALQSSLSVKPRAIGKG